MYDKFIAKFLSWYQDSFSLPDVVTNIKLEELVRAAEEIHTIRIREKELELTEKPNIIDQKELKKLEKHIENLKKQGKIKGRLVKYTKKHNRK